jgi:hypothetical protein
MGIAIFGECAARYRCAFTKYRYPHVPSAAEYGLTNTCCALLSAAPWADARLPYCAGYPAPNLVLGY